MKKTAKDTAPKKTKNLATTKVSPNKDIKKAKAKIISLGKQFHRRGWSLATSSNYSALVSRKPYQLLITASGKHKENLGMDDFLTLNEKGVPLEKTEEKPSAETALHLLLTGKENINSVLHVHSVWGTILSEKYGSTGGFWVEGYEMLKGLSGIKSHESRIWIDIYPNSQDITALAKKVNERTFSHKEFVPFGFLIRKHGLYAWGANLEEAQRHVETLEFLFEVTGRSLLIHD